VEKLRIDLDALLFFEHTRLHLHIIQRLPAELLARVFVY
jgi:hypothetical protein